MTVTTTDPLVRRYGGAEPDEAIARNDVVDLLLRHRSVRRYTREAVPPATVGAIIAAAQSAATSSNSQAWSVIEVRDTARLAEVARLAGGQAFITTAQVFLVFVVDWARAAQVAERQHQPTAAIGFIESTLVGFVDAALAAQNAVVAAESFGLGTVYVGSVRNAPVEIADLLGLPGAAFPVVGVAIGHPDPDEQAGVKPRLPQSVIRSRERYRAATAEDIAAYDVALGDHHETYGARRGWIAGIVQRVRDVSGLHGRHAMRAWLRERGLPSD